jgi:hypothetical protein
MAEVSSDRRRWLPKAEPAWALRSGSVELRCVLQEQSDGMLFWVVELWSAERWDEAAACLGTLHFQGKDPAEVLRKVAAESEFNPPKGKGLWPLR